MKEERKKLAKFMTDTIPSLSNMNDLFMGGFVYGTKDVDHRAKMLGYSLNGWKIPRELQAIEIEADPMTEVYKIGQKKKDIDITYIG